MDFFTTLLIMAVLYLLPELFKKRKSKEYQYPHIPEKPKTEILPLPAKETEPSIQKQGKEPFVMPATPVVAAPSADTTAVLGSQNPWQGNLSQSMVLNGIIFAEIISPPLAKRQHQNLHRGYRLK